MNSAAHAHYADLMPARCPLRPVPLGISPGARSRPLMPTPHLPWWGIRAARLKHLRNLEMNP